MKRGLSTFTDHTVRRERLENIIEEKQRKTKRKDNMQSSMKA